MHNREVEAVKLIPNWRQAWRWYSVNCSMLSVAVLAAWAALPEAMQNSFSPLELKASAIVLTLLGIGGRFVDQQKAEKS